MPDTPEVQELRNELRVLREELAALRDRVKKLEDSKGDFGRALRSRGIQ